MKKLFRQGMVISLLLCSLLGTTVMAEGSIMPDIDAKGSISVTMRNAKGISVSGGNLTVYPVAKAFRDKTNNDYFKITDEFIGYEGFERILGLKAGDPIMRDLESTDLESNALIDGLTAYAKAKKLNGITENINGNGNVVFKDLDLGLYLVTQNNPASGYYAVKAFLITVPQKNEAGWIYSVDASPKVEALKEKPVKPKKPSKESKPTGKLPQTGQLNWPIPVMLGAGVVMIMVGCGLRKSRGKKKYA